MKLPFGLCARGLAFTMGAILLSGCTSFSTFFQNNAISIEDQTSKQQRLGTIQLRVAKTALAHRDYNAAIGLFEEAAENRTIRRPALLHLGKLHGLRGNRQAELATYRTLLKEYPDHAEARGRLAVLIGPKPYKRPRIEASASTRTAPTQPRVSDINVSSKILDEIQAPPPSKSKASIGKSKRKNIIKKQLVKKVRSERLSTKLQPQIKAPIKDKRRASESRVSSRQGDKKLFRVQLAAFRYKSNAVRALEHFNTTITPNKNLFALLTRNALSNNQKGIHYRIRTKAMITASAAENICKQVRSSGQNCLVIMHNQTMWRSSA
jgi:hypothetical protein